MNGITYKQVIAQLYKPTMAYTIEKDKERINDEVCRDIPTSLKFKYNSRSDNNNFIDDEIEIIGMSKQVFDLFVCKNTLSKMLDNELLSESFVDKVNKQIHTIESKVFDLEMKISQKKFITEKVGCYLWVYNNERFIGVFSGIPQELLSTVLNKNQTFTCELCKQSVTSNIFPDMYYNTETLECYCPNCIDLISKKNIKHVGS